MNNISDKEAMLREKFIAWHKTKYTGSRYQEIDGKFLDPRLTLDYEIWQAATESCLSEFEQCYVTKQGSKLVVDGDVTRFLADDTPLYTRKPVDKT